MAETVSEKVVRLETQMTNITGEIVEVKGLVKEVILKVDLLTTLTTEVQSLKLEIDNLKRKTFRNGWIFPTLSAVASSVLTILILSYVNKLGGR